MKRGVTTAAFAPAIRILPASCAAASNPASVCCAEAAYRFAIRSQKQPVNTMPKLCTSLMNAPGPPLLGSVLGIWNWSVLKAWRGSEALWPGNARPMPRDSSSAVLSTKLRLRSIGAAASSACRVAGSPSAVSMAMQSPKASWKAPTSRKFTSKKSGRTESSRPWPTSCATTSVLAPEKKVVLPTVWWKNEKVSRS